MDEASAFRLVYCTCPDQAVAERLAGLLVEQGLAACVNIVPGLTSVYVWQGEVQKDAEVLLLIKTHVDCYPHLQAVLREAHPYELPEIVAVSFSEGLPDYFSWIKQVVNKQ